MNNKIKKIQEPVFIHHSLDDNRVNVKASLEFYRLAKLAKKEHLIKLFIDDHGSSVDEKEEADLHGHFFPENYYLQLFSEQFIDFINSNGKKVGIVSNKATNSGSLVSHAFHIYDTDNDSFNGYEFG